MRIKMYLSVIQLSRALNIPKGTIYFWVSKNKIPHLRFGKHIRFEYEEVIAYFKRQPSRNTN